MINKSLYVSSIRNLPNNVVLDQDHLAHLSFVIDSIRKNASLGIGFAGLTRPVKIYVKRNDDGTTSNWIIGRSDEYYLRAFEVLSREDSRWLRIQCNLYYETDLPTWDHAQLLAIDDDLTHAPLSVLERSEMIARRDEILNRLGVRAKAGYNQHATEGDFPVIKTAEEIADELGVSRRNYYYGLEIGNKIAPAVKELIRQSDTGIKNKTMALLQIARAGDEKAQRQELQSILSKMQQKATVRATCNDSPAPGNVVTLPQRGSRKPDPVSAVQGQKWKLGYYHHLFCGSVTGGRFIEDCPEAALAIAPVLSGDYLPWMHNWLLDKAQILAVPCAPEQIIPLVQALDLQGVHYRALSAVGRLLGKRSAVTIFLLSRHKENIPLPSNVPTVHNYGDLYDVLIANYSAHAETVVCPDLQDESAFLSAEQTNRHLYGGVVSSETASRILNAWQERTTKKVHLVKSDRQLAIAAG